MLLRSPAARFAADNLQQNCVPKPSDVGLVTATSRSASLATAGGVGQLRCARELRCDAATALAVKNKKNKLVAREFETSGVFLGWRRRWWCLGALRKRHERQRQEPQFLCLALSPWNTTSSLTMPSYRKPPTNNDSSIGGEEQKAEASEGPQRSGISGLLHPVPGCHSFGECHPLQQPKQDVPLNPPLRRPREDLSLNPLLVLGTTTPLMLFQDAFAVLNDFCGNLCTKIPSGHRHMYPYYKRAVCNSEDLLATFETVVRVADYMAVVEKMFDCSRDDMVDLAEALIVALMKILEKLRHEAIPKEKTWRVDLSDMVDFLVDPNSRDHLTVAQQQIRDMCDTIAVTLTSANPPSMTRRQ
ncbi:uncharacterized protein LOC142761703 isoform X2 [Rhipicephalus microplus]|uniref:uncharacterized protein LOC142761703 isoform X2 n=1 Tax=Rhipicephalus microplus TaxID=6941 RepID=UPI003F6B98C2